jgi:archaellum biogenesis protein FlaJ (TadC family)
VEQILQFVQAEWFWWLSLISLVMFVGGLIALRFIVIYLPADFLVAERNPLSQKINPVVYVLLVILRNVVGLVILLAGVIMLFTPGQGVLSIVVGLMLMTFPGKRALILRLVRISSVHKGLNTLRARYNKPPILVSRE